MIVKILTEHHLEFLSLKGGCRGSSESTNVKIPHCWKSHALVHICCCDVAITGKQIWHYLLKHFLIDSILQMQYNLCKTAAQN